MTGDELRARFLGFFEARGHVRVASSPVVIPHDPTLLFVNAGMVQFKDVFRGSESRSYDRAVSAQKCVRAGGKHNDIEEVGRTARHLTFFEMLGNFSFGSYFKKGAIQNAWDFLIVELGLEIERLWFTVYDDDDESAALWEEVGASPERVLRFGAAENFWEMGDTGPCGPCSEIHYFRGDDLSQNVAELVNGPGDTTIELWNLVFMQFDRAEDGALTPLPRPQIDTGMGLERLAAVVQGVNSTFDTDLIRPLIEHISARAGKPYDEDTEDGFAMRAIADHARLTAVLVSDGIFPGNEGRAYVLRKIMRRALWQARRLGLPKLSFAELVDRAVELLGDAYPDLREARATTRRVVAGEETLFETTLEVGTRKLEQILERTEGAVVSGDDAFLLYDTHGLRRDLIEYMVASTGRTVDWAAFESQLERQRTGGRSSWRGGAAAEDSDVWQRIAARNTSEFEGYTRDVVADSEVMAIVVDGEERTSASCGDKAIVVLDRTPFYAESGGQVGDTGTLRGAQGEGEVERTYSPARGVVAHVVNVTSGQISTSDVVEARIDVPRRRRIRANHTATHLLHAALREVLGGHVRQAGSLVASDRLRFDFTHFSGLTHDEIRRIEQIVNEQIVADHQVATDLLSLDEAVASGAMALFEERYGDVVRVVTIDGFSRELCGGTHVRATGEIGLLKIVRESAVASGTRRIEALTGAVALNKAQDDEEVLAAIAESLNVDDVARLPDRISALQRRVSELTRTVEQLKVSQALGPDASDAAEVTDVDGVRVVRRTVEGLDAAASRELAERLIDGAETAVVIIGRVDEGRARIVVRVSRGAQESLHAGRLVGRLAETMGARGGGSGHLGEAGGGDPNRLDDALSGAPAVIRAMLANARHDPASRDAEPRTELETNERG
jgi:alanyl-tRNA synthetase